MDRCENTVSPGKSSHNIWTSNEIQNSLSLSLYSQMSFDNLCGEFYFPRLETTVSTLESLPALLPVGIFLTILMVMSEDNGELC